MALQNRVLPTGEIVADPARGLFTGNRGCLHDDQRRLGRARWKGKAWIICELNFKGWKRQVMSPGSWTELFFLDEAVALAAGHRPCALCRRGAYDDFRAAWSGELKAVEMDAALHGVRLGERVWQESEGLPDGVFVRVAGQSFLLLGARMLAYEPAGYGGAVERVRGQVEVLTPAPTVAVLRAGYRPVLHGTAGQGRGCRF